MSMKKLFLKIARIPALGKFVGWVVKHLGSLLPLRKVVDNRDIIVFHHPVPSSSVHLLAMLKTQVPDVRSITPKQLDLILDTAREAVRRMNISAPHVHVMTNGGRFQEVKQMHFHICTSENSPAKNALPVGTRTWGKVAICEYTRGSAASVNFLMTEASRKDFISVLPEIYTAYAGDGRGYTVVFDLAEPDRIYIRLENRSPAA